MSVTTSGLEFKLFYHDPQFWPEKSDIYHEDVVFLVNGMPLGEDQDPTAVADSDALTLSGGAVLGSPLYREGKEPSIEAYFKRWKKEQTTVSFVVTCDKSQVDAIKAAVTAAGGKVSR